MKNIIISLLLLTTLTLNAQQLAFPGAEGFGKYASGGRTGSVYHVTNLNDSGAGSFRDAVSQPNRIVVFDVGGIIKLNSVCVVNKNITIAGQTAPGDGITITGERVAFNSSSGNSIVRYIRVRLPRAAGSTDAMSISDNADNLIFDHVSVTWGADGTFDINTNEAENITIQDCIIGQGADWKGHSTGGLIQCGPISIIRTLWIDNNTRNPKIRFEHELINNVVYNWGTNGLIMGDTENGYSYCNLLGNYFIAGPSGSSSNYITGTTSYYNVYASDNWLDGDKNGVLDGSQLIAANGAYKTATVVSIPYNYPGVNTILSAQDAVAHIIANAGPSINRDAVDTYLINQLKSYGTQGAIVIDETSNGIPNGGLGYVFNGPKPADSDNDGMPDAWEDANLTDKNVNDAMTLASNGYANIENYIHSINGPVMPFLKYPTNISSSATNTTSIDLTWTNNDASATELIIEYGTSSSSFPNSLIVSGTATSTTISGLVSGTNYYFRIKAKNATLVSAYSDVATIPTKDEPTLPLTCSSPNPTNGGLLNFFAEVTLSWDNLTNSAGGTLYFDVYFGENEASMSQIANDITAKTWNIGSLSAEKTYYWRVDATNTMGTTTGITWSFSTTSGIERQKSLYIPFDETTGIIADNIISDNDATAVNINPEWQTGKLNNSVYMAGTTSNQYFKVAHYPDLYFNTTSFTISLWFKSPGGIADSYLFHKGMHDLTNNGTGKWIGIQYKGTTLTFAIDDNSVKTNLDITSASGYFNNTWHHLACVRDVTNDKLLVYLDGTKMGEKTDGSSAIGETGDLIIGNRNGYFDNPFPGNIDELIIYKSALSAAEIAYIAKNTSLPTDIRQRQINNRSFHVSPNPFTDRVNIAMENKDLLRGSLYLLNMAGKVVFQTKFQSQENDITIDGLNNLPQGIYSFIIKTDDKIYSQKLVKR